MVKETGSALFLWEELVVTIGSHNRPKMMCSFDVFLFVSREKGSEKRLAGGRLNKKDGLTRYGDFHVKDKTS